MRRKVRKSTKNELKYFNFFRTWSKERLCGFIAISDWKILKIKIRYERRQWACYFDKCAEKLQWLKI